MMDTIPDGAVERTLVFRDGVGAAAHIVQRQELLATRIFIEQPTIILVRRGEKRLRCAGRECIVKAGCAVAVAGDQTFDVVNRPSQGSYEATWLAISPNIVLEAYSGGDIRIRDALPLDNVGADFIEAFDRSIEAIAAIDTIPASVAASRIGEVLSWLRSFGGMFGCRQQPTVSLEVRSILASDLAASWRASAITSRLGMSEATLRRRLAAEGRSLSELLIDVRMSRALTLLQVTDRPVGQIAYSVGYQSPSRFAARFRQRFGFAPGDVRKADMLRLSEDVQGVQDPIASVQAVV